MALAARMQSAERSVAPDPNMGSRAIASRPMLLLERTMYRDGKTPFTSLFTIRLNGALQVLRLRGALARVQAKHPLLRCVVQDASTAPRFVLLEQPAPISLRVVERQGEEHWQQEARREWLTPFNGAREALVRFVLIRGSGVAELLLVAHHCICDGHSGMTLLRDLLTAYATENDLPAYEQFGGVGELVPTPVLNNRGFQRRVRWKQRGLRLLLRFKTGGLPPTQVRIPGERMYFDRWSMSQPEATALAERCKQENVTILAAVSLSFMQAFRDVRGARALRKVNAMVNARRFLPQLKRDALFGLAPGVNLSTRHLPVPNDMSIDDFWARSRLIKANLNQRIDGLEASIYGALMSFEGLHDKYRQVVDFFERRPPAPHLTFSNMGRLDLPEESGGLHVDKVYSPLVMVSPTPANTLVLSSFGREMEFALVSDEQSLPRTDAQRIRDRATAILRASLAVAV